MSELLLKTQKFNIVRETVRTPGAKQKTREIVRHPGACVLVPMVDNDRVCLIRNFRISVNETLIELPAGTLEPKPGIPPSPTHLAALVPKMKADGVRLVLIETYRERDTPSFVAEKSGARVVSLPIMPRDRDAPDYFALIDDDVRQISEALKP